MTDDAPTSQTRADRDPTPFPVTAAALVLAFTATQIADASINTNHWANPILDHAEKPLSVAALAALTLPTWTLARRAGLTPWRVLAATNRDPLQAVRDGTLREALYYRLHVIPIALPALRERSADILLLAESFLARYASEEGKTFSGFARDAEEWLISHSWPGNVRELENLIRQIAVLKESGEIGRSDMPVSTASPQSSPTPSEPTASTNVLTADDSEPDYGLEPLWMTEKKAIERAIALCRGNIVAAAKQLQINPSTIYRKKASWNG